MLAAFGQNQHGLKHSALRRENSAKRRRSCQKSVVPSAITVLNLSRLPRDISAQKRAAVNRRNLRLRLRLKSDLHLLKPVATKVSRDRNRKRISS